MKYGQGLWMMITVELCSYLWVDNMTWDGVLVSRKCSKSFVESSGKRGNCLLWVDPHITSSVFHLFALVHFCKRLLDSGLPLVLRVAPCNAQFILPGNANAIRILMSQDCFLCECFAGVEYKSTDANYSLWSCTQKFVEQSHLQEVWTGLMLNVSVCATPYVCPWNR